MKHNTILTVVVFSVLLFTQLSYAKVNAPSSKTNTYSSIELNRLIGLQSENEGLRISCAFNLGEMKSKNAVIPLMKILRESNSYEERIIAALSLIKIGDTQGAYMVGRVAQFNDDPKVSYFCEKFYNAYLTHQDTTTPQFTTDAVATN
jgi:hypothetical protein